MTDLQSNTKYCLVCGSDDKINFRYGIYSCEACKKFFERSITNNRYMVYCCGNQQKCDVQGFNRNNCKKCRYLKCVESGMSPKGSDHSKALADAAYLIVSKNCQVCDAESNGIHFGKITCEGCKVIPYFVLYLYSGLFDLQLLTNFYT